MADHDPPSEPTREELEAIGGLVVDASPHAASLGMRMVAMGEDCCTLEAPYDKSLVGDPETGVFHGGVATALLDHASAVAAALGMKADASPATLDLRIDYFRGAEPGRALVAEAKCVKTTRHIAFVSAIAHDGDRDNPVASARSAFIIPANAKRRKGQGE